MVYMRLSFLNSVGKDTVSNGVQDVMHSPHVFTCLTLMLMSVSQQIWDVVNTAPPRLIGS